MLLKKCCLGVLLVILCFFTGNAKKNPTYDEKLTNAINSFNWFKLDSIYKEAPKDSIDNFLEIYSRCLIGNRFNRPDISIPAFSELFDTNLNSHSRENIFTFAKMYANDLSLIGENEKAVSVLSSFLDSKRKELGSYAIVIEQLINKYKGLASLKPYTITIGDDVGVIPFRIEPFGKKEKETMLNHLSSAPMFVIF